MQFVKDFFRNLLIVAAIGFVIYLVEPVVIRQVIALYGTILAPILVAVIILLALPWNFRKK
jgi:hypothetical protein